MNLLFLVVLLAVATGVAVHLWWHRRRRPHPLADTPEQAFGFARRDDWPLAPEHWSIEDIQFAAAPDRPRYAVTVHIDDPDDDHCREAMQILAHEIYRATEVDAVLVQARRSGADSELLLFAADGRGWWGGEPLSTASTLGTPNLDAPTGD